MQRDTKFPPPFPFPRCCPFAPNQFPGPVSQLFPVVLLFPSFHPLSGFQLLETRVSGSPVWAHATPEVPQPGAAHPCSLPCCPFLPECSQNRLHAMYTHLACAPNKLPVCISKAFDDPARTLAWVAASPGAAHSETRTPYTCNTVTSCSRASPALLESISPPMLPVCFPSQVTFCVESISQAICPAPARHVIPSIPSEPPPHRAHPTPSFLPSRAPLFPPLCTPASSSRFLAQLNDPKLPLGIIVPGRYPIF